MTDDEHEDEVPDEDYDELDVEEPPKKSQRMTDDEPEEAFSQYADIDDDQPNTGDELDRQILEELQHAAAAKPSNGRAGRTTKRNREESDSDYVPGRDSDNEDTTDPDSDNEDAADPDPDNEDASVEEIHEEQGKRPVERHEPDDEDIEDIEGFVSLHRSDPSAPRGESRLARQRSENRETIMDDPGSSAPERETHLAQQRAENRENAAESGENPEPEPAQAHDAGPPRPEDNPHRTLAELLAGNPLWMREPFEDWPVLNDIDKSIARRFVGAIQNQQSILYDEQEGRPVGYLLPWVIAKKCRVGTSNRDDLDIARKTLADNPELAHELAEGRWGKVYPVWNTTKTLEHQLSTYLRFRHVVMPDKDAKWIIRMCKKHRGFNDRFGTDFYPPYISELMPPTDQCPYGTDSEEGSKWRHRNLKKAARDNPIQFQWWSVGSMGTRCAPDEYDQTLGEIDERVQEARRIAGENGWK